VKSQEGKLFYEFSLGAASESGPCVTEQPAVDSTDIVTIVKEL